MDKKSVVAEILQKNNSGSFCERAYAFAPTNLALCKYWGKRDEELNLPVTSSLSITLDNKGAYTSIQYTKDEDSYLVNGQKISMQTSFAKRLHDFLDLFRPNPHVFYHIETDLNIPVAAGLASSACGFAALVNALNNFYDWRLDKQKLSILARLGSGSACRSFWNGFVKWHVGSDPAGMDSFATPLPQIWPELRIGILVLSKEAKPLSSREAMRRTVQTSTLYADWPQAVEADLFNLEQAIATEDFELFGKTAEANAVMMHELMLDAKPPIQYSLPETFAAMTMVQKMREAGVEVYFTQDAGPNLQLLFRAKDTSLIKDVFENVTVITPFGGKPEEHLVLVDEKDQEIAISEKIAAHEKGDLHRAFSIFLLRFAPAASANEDFDDIEDAKSSSLEDFEIEVLLQKRAGSKYHSGGLWSNTCCGHPRPGERILAAANRRLEEEMGIKTRLQELGSFQYKVALANNLKENEIDHVFLGFVRESEDLNILPNPIEVEASAWVPLSVLQEELELIPQKYTPWMKPAFEFLLEKLAAIELA